MCNTGRLHNSVMDTHAEIGKAGAQCIFCVLCTSVLRSLRALRLESEQQAALNPIYLWVILTAGVQLAKMTPFRSNTVMGFTVQIVAILGTLRLTGAVTTYCLVRFSLPRSFPASSIHLLLCLVTVTVATQLSCKSIHLPHCLARLPGATQLSCNPIYLLHCLVTLPDAIQLSCKSTHLLVTLLVATQLPANLFIFCTVRLPSHKRQTAFNILAHGTPCSWTVRDFSLY